MSLSRRFLTGAVALATAATLAACGRPDPLEGLSDTQVAQLDAAWSARISATDTATIPAEHRNERVKALYKACEGLDGSTPLLAAVGAACQPVAISTKLSAVLPERCATPNASCVRALDRVAQTTETVATTSASLSDSATKAIADAACRAEFVTTETQLKAYGDLAQAYRVLATGVEQRDKDISSLGQRRIDDARTLIGPKGRVDERTLRFRQACGLAD